jgi:hypothetical protein
MVILFLLKGLISVSFFSISIAIAVSISVSAVGTRRVEIERARRLAEYICVCSKAHCAVQTPSLHWSTEN